MCYEQEALGSCVAGKDVFALILINQCGNYYCDVADYVFMSVISIIIAITMLMIAMIILIIYIIIIVITITFPY